MEGSRTESGQPEEILPGGNTSVVVRVGDTVRRHTGHWTPAVHALLAHLQSVGFGDAPTVLGIDDQGREVLPFVSGEVGTFDHGGPPDWFRSIDACMAIGDWLRRFHDAQRGFTPDPALPWRRYGGRALREGEVVVHHDVAPYNTIRRLDGGLTVIDWDFAGPGDPVEDLAFSAWQWIPLWADHAVPADGQGEP
jgi:Phosphotransferase enzyme family